MPKKKNLKKVLVIGSGPIIIGQAAEFDYAGSQACRALKEEGLEVVLVNSNPATIMTDTNIADRVYIEPLTLEFLTAIIEKERPDGLLATLGGQAGLNLAVKLSESGVLEKNNVELLGTSLIAIKKAEDRELFKETMTEIGEPIPESTIVEDIHSAVDFAKQIGYPLIVRPAYTLGGQAGLNLAVKLSESGVLEKNNVELLEYEVMRDANDNCITVCNMENFDPVGVHTGDSIVIAPSQTLTDTEYQLLRSASLKIIRALGIEGGCNVQFALDPQSQNYYVIEVNPRVSRSSALASKATGYPIAKVSSKIAVGYTLDEITNAVTHKTKACFEPALDYCVIKIPRFPFDKFVYADKTLGTQMKATGEVMSIDRTFEGALLKAVRSLEIGVNRLHLEQLDEWDNDKLKKRLARVNDERIFVIAEVLRRNIATVDEIYNITKVDRWFINKIKNITDFEVKLSKEDLNLRNLRAAKLLGLSDKSVAEITGRTEIEVRQLRFKNKIFPFYKMVDTCAAEFEAVTPYYYSTYRAEEDEVETTINRKVIVLGSGPIRIGQGVEFDYCSVHSVWALREMGIEAIIINNNPETVF